MRTVIVASPCGAAESWWRQAVDRSPLRTAKFEFMGSIRPGMKSSDFRRWTRSIAGLLNETIDSSVSIRTPIGTRVTTSLAPKISRNTAAGKRFRQQQQDQDRREQLRQQQAQARAQQRQQELERGAQQQQREQDRNAQLQQRQAQEQREAQQVKQQQGQDRPQQLRQNPLQDRQLQQLPRQPGQF